MKRISDNELELMTISLKVVLTSNPIAKSVKQFTVFSMLKEFAAKYETTEDVILSFVQGNDSEVSFTIYKMMIATSS